jgi:flagellar FliJ protein
MKRFHFSLEKVLELRSYSEQEAKQALARARGELIAIQQKIEKLAEERSIAGSQRFSTGLSVAEIHAIDLYLVRLDKMKEKLLEAEIAAELVVEEKQQVYIEASRDRKVIDKLKEKRLNDYKREISREDIKVIDDSNNGAPSRKNIQQINT